MTLARARQSSDQEAGEEALGAVPARHWADGGGDRTRGSRFSLPDDVCDPYREHGASRSMW